MSRCLLGQPGPISHGSFASGQVRSAEVSSGGQKFGQKLSGPKRLRGLGAARTVTKGFGDDGRAEASLDRISTRTYGGVIAQVVTEAIKTTMSAEFVLDTPLVRAFVAEVEKKIAGARSPVEACEEIRPGFADLLADRDWLPGVYQDAVPESGMGGGIGQWLLYRADGGSLSLFSLVVPPGSETPIHDHLAWGLVGLYRGRQGEEIYRRRAGSLELVEQRTLDDIHRVRTTSAETSVSIHLLTNDTGCVWRHTYEPGSGLARPFRSGYVNVPCDDELS